MKPAESSFEVTEKEKETLWRWRNLGEAIQKFTLLVEYVIIML